MNWKNKLLDVVASDDEGKDEVDAEPEEEEEVNLCTYVFIDSRDQLLLNFSPPAIDVIMEVSEVNQVLSCLLSDNMDVSWAVSSFTEKI